MTAHKYVTVWCDNVTRGDDCPRFVETHHHLAKRARHEAARAGWLTALPGGRDLCPDHDRLIGPRPKP